MFQKTSFVFPFIAIPIAMMLGADPSRWWAYLLVAGSIDAGLYALYRLTSQARQYLSGYVEAVEWHYEWRERVETTEVKYDEVTKKSYTVKKVEFVDHPSEYFWILNTGHSDSITSNTYHSFVQKWDTPRYRISVPHPNLVSGGDGERCTWDGIESQATTVTYRGRYYNPLRHSHSVFSPRHVSKKKAHELGLFDRPKLHHEHQVVLCQPNLMTETEIHKANRALQLLNAFEGLRHEIHAYILIFPNSKDLEITALQRDYWEGLHKNEFVVCIGLQKKKVKWCNTLSWMDAPTLDLEVKKYFFRHTEDIDLLVFIYWLRNNLSLWKRKEFHDFKYLGRKMSLLETILYWTATLLLTALTTYICLGVGEE